MAERDRCWRLLERLFGQYRTLMGEGYLRSLEMLREIVPLEIVELPSGTRCGSWTIPDEWSIRDAFVSTTGGERVIDFRASCFHLWQYSAPFSGEVSREELLRHLATSEAAPDGIPLCVTYYRRNWGFSVAAAHKRRLTDERYRVEVDSDFRAGALRVGEAFFPGERADEILIDAVLSCAALANNLSGVVVAAFLAERLAALPRRRFSYRVLFTPETLGPIALFHLRPGFGRAVAGGYTLVNLADRSGRFSYKRSRPGATVADRAMAHALRHSGAPFTVEEYDVRTGSCGNEKAYNSLGIEIPVGALRRRPLGSYPEYDTSLDDLRFVDGDALFASLETCWSAIQALERSRVYRHRFVGEPFLTGYGLLPKIVNERQRLPYDYLMGFTTGELDLVEIADRAGVPVTELDEAVALMEGAGLIEPVDYNSSSSSSSRRK